MAGEEVHIPAGYATRMSFITPGSGRCYKPSDFQEGLEVLIYFARRKPLGENAIRKCLVLDTSFKKKRKGFGNHPALKVRVDEAWDIKDGRWIEKGIISPDTYFFYDSIKKAFKID